MKFKKIIVKERTPKEFDIDEKIKMAGKEIKIYDLIQESREDTEIIPTLQKYGCIDRLIVDKQALYGDFTELNDLRDIYDKKIKAEQMFNSLPAEIKDKFNNSIQDFVKNGEKVVKKMIDDEIKAKTPVIETPVIEKTEMKGSVNE